MADGAMQRIVRIHEKRGPRPTKADVERCEAVRIFARRYERITLRFAALHTLDFCRGVTFACAPAANDPFAYE